MYSRYLFLLLICASLIQCKTGKDLNISYTYTDQNNNVISISSERITYNPIAAEESSSGTYSGGDPKSVKISEENFQIISRKAEELFDGAPKNVRREMLTSVLSKRVNEQSTRVILSKSALRNDFEKLLLEFLK